MAKKTKPAFVELPSALAEKIIGLRVVPEEVRLLFVDWALERYSEWCRTNGTKVAVTRAELAFPGPFMRLTANRRSFYFAWDRDTGRGIEIPRGQYPRAAARLQTISVMPMGAASGSIASVRRSLCGDLEQVETN